MASPRITSRLASTTSSPRRLARLVASLTSLVFATAACAEDPAAPPVTDDGWTPTDVVGDRPSPDPRVPPVAPAPRCIPASVPGAAHHGTADIDELRDVAIAADGTILVAGYEGGRPSLQVTPRDSRGVVLALGTSLTPVATLDTLGTDAFEALAIDPATGARYAAARSTAELPGLPGMGGHDIVLGTLDAAGFAPRARGYDGAQEMPRGLVAQGGRLAVAGREHRTTDTGEVWTNPLLGLYGTAGGMAPQWSATRRAPESEVYTAVTLDAAGVVVGGNVGGTVGTPGEGMFVAAWSDDADVRWRTQLSAFALDAVAGVHALPDGTVLWVGTQRVIDAEAGLNHDDIVVGALDGATGAPRWTTSLGTSSDERAVDLAVDAAGAIHVVGAVTSADGADTDVTLHTLAPDGQIVATAQLGSAGHDAPTALAVDPCGTAVIVGGTRGDLGGTPQGGLDGFVLVVR